MRLPQVPLLLSFFLRSTSALPLSIGSREPELVSKSGRVAIGPIVAIGVAGLILLVFVAGCRIRRVQRAARVIRAATSRSRPSQDAEKQSTAAARPVAVQVTTRTTETVDLAPVPFTSFSPAPRRQIRRPSLRLAIPLPRALSLSRGLSRRTETVPEEGTAGDETDTERIPVPVQSINGKLRRGRARGGRGRAKQLEAKRVAIDLTADAGTLSSDRKNEEGATRASVDDWVPPVLPWTTVPPALRPGYWLPGTPTHILNPTLPDLIGVMPPRDDILREGGMRRHTRWGSAGGRLQLHRPTPSPTGADEKDRAADAALHPRAPELGDAASSIISLPLPPYTPSPSPPVPTPPGLLPATFTHYASESPAALWRRHSCACSSPGHSPCASPILFHGPRAPNRTSLLPKRVPVPPVAIVISPPSPAPLGPPKGLSDSLSVLSREFGEDAGSLGSRRSKVSASTSRAKGKGKAKAKAESPDSLQEHFDLTELEGQVGSESLSLSASSGTPSSVDVNILTGRGWD
ncbi:hypothetical protein MKEN_00573200 [Mycena kentingensis (nom. inval.)]|nr:hypothetical protein MKEN_00573200 [Mycena kentingensis (nom. inval.)]